MINSKFDPKELTCPAMNVLAPSPMPIIEITEALPMIIPNIVKLLRSLFAIKVVTAILTLSTISMIFRRKREEGREKREEGAIMK